MRGIDEGTARLFSARPTPAAVLVAAATIVAMTAAMTVAPPPATAGDTAAAMLAAGDRLPALALRDQHGKDAKIDGSVRLLLFTRDMDAGGIVKDVLAEGGREALEAAAAVYVSDVSGMPGLVRSMFALPSLRKRPYPIVLDEDGEATAPFPYEEGRVTVLRLDDGRIVSVAHVGGAPELRETLRP